MNANVISHGKIIVVLSKFSIIYLGTTPLSKAMDLKVSINAELTKPLQKDQDRRCITDSSPVTNKGNSTLEGTSKPNYSLACKEDKIATIQLLLSKLSPAFQN